MDLSTDIQDFFQSTSFELVSAALQSLGYSKHGADLITGLSTLNQNLAEGSPELQRAAFVEVDEIEHGGNRVRRQADLAKSLKTAAGFAITWWTILCSK